MRRYQIHIGLLVAMLLLAIDSGAQPVTKIASGGSTLFLKTDGSLWGMGYNAEGQLGDGHTVTMYPYGTNRPEQIVASSPLKKSFG